MLILAHGLEGSPGGAKAIALREAGLDPVVPDCRQLVLADRYARLDALTAGRDDVLLVGSSYGGLAALALAAHHPDRFRGLLLLAPALVITEAPAGDPDALLAPPGLPTTVLHGVHDDVIPVAASRRLAARSPHVVLHELDDDHKLERSLDRMIAEVRALLAR